MIRRLLPLIVCPGLVLTLTACLGPLADLGEPYPPQQPTGGTCDTTRTR